MYRYGLEPIGKIRTSEGTALILLDGKFAPGLKNLEGFGHVNVIWWFSQHDDEVSRNTLEISPPYGTFTGGIGVFATRSPLRPNPLALTTAEVLDIDHARGILRLGYIDAEDGSPVLDLKPYTPSLDRVENPSVPGWCGYWPGSLEESADFDWESEFSR